MLPFFPSLSEKVLTLFFKFSFKTPNKTKPPLLVLLILKTHNKKTFLKKKKKKKTGHCKAHKKANHIRISFQPDSLMYSKIGIKHLGRPQISFVLFTKNQFSETTHSQPLTINYGLPISFHSTCSHPNLPAILPAICVLPSGPKIKLCLASTHSCIPSYPGWGFGTGAAASWDLSSRFFTNPALSWNPTKFSDRKSNHAHLQTKFLSTWAQIISINRKSTCLEITMSL